MVGGFLEGSDLGAWEETTWRFVRGRGERLRRARQKERKREEKKEKKRMIIMKRQRVSVGVRVADDSAGC